MSVLDRAALQASPLADLHAIASELSIDGYRRLRRAELIDAILARQEGDAGSPAPEPLPEEDEEQPAPRRRRTRRGGRGRPSDDDTEAEEPEEIAAEAPAPAEDELAEGVVELMPNGSGFVRLHPPEPSDVDIYVSAAQIKRCELVSGDRVSGPRRPPRRSERFASLIRIDSINGRPAAELAPSARFDELPCEFPAQRLQLAAGGDATLQAIDSMAPIGRGSRVAITGVAGAGKTETLRRIAGALAEDGELQLSIVLAGVRPEEVAEWSGQQPAPAAAVSFGASSDAQGHAVELAVDQARRMAARGSDAVVLIDTLDGLLRHVARKAMAAARKIVDGGSLTVIATSSEPVGGETTVIALDRALTRAEQFPALDQVGSWTLRAERLK